MNIIKFPAFDFSDPRSGLSIRLAAERLGRVVRFDTVLQRAFLEPKDSTHRYVSPAPVVRFPIDRTRAVGEL